MTGKPSEEPVDAFARMGFAVRRFPLAGASGLYVSPIEREPLRIDWDRLDANRRVSLHRPRVRACAA